MQGKNSPGPSAYYPKLNVGDNAPTQNKVNLHPFHHKSNSFGLTQAAVYSFGGDAMYDPIAKQTPRSNPGPGEHEHPSAISTQVLFHEHSTCVYFGFLYLGVINSANFAPIQVWQGFTFAEAP